MAKRTTILTGLEIEPTAVHAAAVTVNGRVRIEHAAVTRLEPGIVRDGEVHDVEALAEALRELWRDHKDLDKRVRIGVANQKIVVRVIELPPIADPKELEAAVRFQAQDADPDAARERRPGLPAARDRADRPRAAPARPARRRAPRHGRQGPGGRPRRRPAPRGHRPLRLRDGPRAAPRRARHHRRPPQAVLYLAVGGLTNLAVAEGTTCLFTRVVGGGLEAIAVELAERRALTLEHARGWLVRVGLERPLDEVAPAEELDLAFEARTVLVDGVRRIGGEVRNSLDFHAAQDGGAPMVGRAVLTGAGAGVPGFAEALGLELGLPVERGAVEGAPDGRGARAARGRGRPGRRGGPGAEKGGRR